MPTHTLSDVNPVLTSINKARGLPNEHYISKSIFDEERQSVLFNNWSGIGFGKDIPKTGDAKPIEFLGMPLLLIRDRDGSIGVFQNTCRHRGMILITEPRKIRGVISCPYHGWCYGMNGELRSTPDVGGAGQNTHEDICNEELSLTSIRSYVWHDIIFVNISGDAPEFVDYAANLMERFKEFEQPAYHGGDSSSLTIEIKTNWKLAVENYCESYHLPQVHPGLNTYSKLEDHYNIEAPGAYSGQGTVVYQQLKAGGNQVFDDFNNLSDKWNEGAEYIALYPNVLLGVHRDHTFGIIVEPIDTDKSIEHIEFYYSKDPADTPEQENLRQANAKLWKTVFDEDIFVVEGMQKGRYGKLFDGGKFSTVMDGPTHNFHHWIATQIKNGRNQSGNQ